MLYLDGCDEVLDFLVQHCEDHHYCVPQENIEFQGTVCTAGGIGAANGPIFYDKKRDCMFVIQNDSYTDTFTVSIYKNGWCLDQTFGIALPKYVLKEMTSTIKGDF